MKRDREAERAVLRATIKAAFDAAREGKSIDTVDLALAGKDKEEEAENFKKEAAFEASRQGAAFIDLMGVPIGTLKVDRVIQKRLSARQTKMLTDRGDLNRIARRMLEIAYFECEHAKSSASRTKSANYLETLADKAGQASQAIAGLLRHLTGGKVNNEQIVLRLLSLEISAQNDQLSADLSDLQADKSVIQNRSKTFDDAKRRVGEIAKEASALMAVAALTAQLHDRSALKANRARSAYHRDANASRTNLAPETAFAMPVAEAWAFMTSKRPSQGADETPFLVFLREAWKDVYGDEAVPNFVGAIKHLRDVELDLDEPPSWLGMVARSNDPRFWRDFTFIDLTIWSLVND